MENFHLEQNEELFSIIDRVKRSRDRNITLVIPGGLSALRSVINLKILKEEAVSLGKNISIFTSDVLIKKLAQQSGLIVLERPDEEEKGWPRQLMEVAARPGGRESEHKKVVMSDIVSPKEPVVSAPIEVEEVPIEEGLEEPPEETLLPDKLSEIYKERPEKPSFRFFTKKRIITTIVIVGLIIGGFVLYFVLPRVQVVVYPKKETIRFETEITADKTIDSIDTVTNSIPAQAFQLEMEDSKKFPTTGEKDVEEHAKGIITVFNQYSSEPQTLVKTTRFLSKNGRLFRLMETTVIPGAAVKEGEIVPSSKDVEVIADEAGDAYNIDPSKFTIPGFEGSPKYDAFYGESKDSMTGGAKGKMRVATEEDVEGALEIVSIEVESKVREEFSKKIPEELTFLEETQILEIVETNSTLGPDEPGKDFTVTVKARVWGLAFKEENVFQLIEESVSNKISENKTLLSSSIVVDYIGVDLNSEQGKADFSCQVEAAAAWKIDTDVIKDDLAGKDEIEVRKYLSSLSEIESAKVIFWPFWVKSIPKNKNKIEIIINTDVDTE